MQVVSAPLTIFGPQNYVRVSGPPTTESAVFAATAGGIITINLSSQVPSGVAATIELNGTPLFVVDSPTPLPATIQAVALASNTISVTRTGKPGSTLTVVITQADPVSEIPGLVLHYPLNGSGDDVSGSGLHASITNGEYVADRFGVPLRAFHLPTNTGWGAASFPAGSPLSIPTSGQFSVSMWVHLDSLPTADLAGIFLTIGLNDFGIGLAQRAGGATFAQVCTPTDFCFTTEGVPGAVSNVLSAGQWAHLSATYDGATHGLGFYLNGQLAGTLSVTLSPHTLDTGLWFGAAPFAPQYWARGALDDIRFYNRILTAAEIGTLATH